jgi:hypothetical protein
MPDVPYAWQHKGNPILLPLKKANRLTVFGLMSINCHLKHYTTVGSMNSEKLIDCIDDFCRQIT